MQSVFILGRQPALGLAELESLYGARTVQPVGAPGRQGALAALLDVEPDLVDFDRLGGSTKFAKLLTVIDTHDWRDIDRFLVKAAPDQASFHPEGKLTIGISAYGLKVTARQIEATGLNIKKAIRKTGRSVRLVPNKDTELNTAQVLHNNLAKQNGWELLLIRDGNRTVLAQTLLAQDIESYTVRDRERPKRDARVGMLPPKLAQILINLSVGELPLGTAVDYIDEPARGEPARTAPKDSEKPVILDPFCGTGVVLQEALLTGYGAYGSDIEPRMVQYSQANIEWLKQSFAFADMDVQVEIGDATTHRWGRPFSHVACETYLGRPFTTLPSPEVLTQTITECNLIIKKFLQNIAGQIPGGTRLCLAVPAWQSRAGQFRHLPLLGPMTDPGRPGSKHLDSLERLGYNRISFEHAASDELRYYREGQIVARQLLVIVKK